MKIAGGVSIKAISALLVFFMTVFFVTAFFLVISLAKTWSFRNDAESCLTSAKLEVFAATEAEAEIASAATSIICQAALESFEKLNDLDIWLLPEESIGAIILAGQPDEPLSPQDILRVLRSYKQLKPELLRREQADRRQKSVSA